VSPLAEDDMLRPEDSPNEALDAKDVARMLKVSYRTVLRLAERGELPYFRVGDLWRFERKDVEEFIKRNKQHGKKEDQNN
jgi:excisionase family DNA binding protein